MSGTEWGWCLRLSLQRMYSTPDLPEAWLMMLRLVLGLISMLSFISNIRLQGTTTSYAAQRKSAAQREQRKCSVAGVACFKKIN